MTEKDPKGGPDVCVVHSGACLIINNRSDYEFDALTLQKTFMNLNFRVEMKENLTSAEMLTAVNEMADNERKQKESSNAIVVIVLTRVKGDVLCGANIEEETGLTYEDLVQPLNNRNCKPLQKKPKLFFILTSIEGSGMEDALIRRDRFLKKPFVTLPETSDVLISVYAQEYSIIKDKHVSSPFVQHLQRQLYEYSNSIDLLSILHLIDRCLQRDVSTEGNKVFTSVKLLGWTKKVFFSSSEKGPGLKPRFLSIEHKKTIGFNSLCLIINNMVFDGIPNRAGSSEDESKLRDFFDRKNFLVKVKRDLTAQEMLKSLTYLTEYFGTEINTNAVVVVILSHGKDNVIFGSDYEALTFSQIVGTLENSSHPELTGIPKMFFIQACRGRKLPVSVEDSLPFTGNKNIRSFPDISNLLFSYSAQPGFVALRDVKRGTPYISHLVDVLNQYSDHLNLLDILLMVEQKMEETHIEFRIDLTLSTSIELFGWPRNMFLCSEKEIVAGNPEENRRISIYPGEKSEDIQKPDQNTSNTSPSSCTPSNRSNAAINIAVNVHEDPDEYKVSGGTCLIINNRPEFEYDAQLLGNVYRNLNFQIIWRSNLTSQKMLEAVEELATNSRNNKENYVAVVIILTWRKGDIIWGTDYHKHNGLNYRELVQPLNNELCKPLKDKPKMFFVFTYNEGNKEDHVPEIAEKPEAKKKKKRFPKTSDVLISFTAQEGESFIKDKGSPYVNHLAKVLGECSSHLDLMKMLLLVEKRMKTTQMEKKQIGQRLKVFTCVRVLGWSKKVFFNSMNQNLEHFNNSSCDINACDMKKKLKGPCLIINNKYYTSYAVADRYGTEIDEQHLEIFFHNLGFSVEVARNRDRKGMLKALNEMAENREFNKESEAAVVVILAHGGENIIHGIDSMSSNPDIITLEELIKPFENRNCPELEGKPKMFFIQACKGNKRSYLEKEDFCFSVRNDDTRPFPDISDVLLSYSSQPDHRSMRFCTGAPYIAHLLHHLALDSNNLDLLDILLKVENKMRKEKKTIDGQEICLSTSLDLLGWDKKIFFNADIQDMADSFPYFVSTKTENEKLSSTLCVLGGSVPPEGLSEDEKQWIALKNIPLERDHQIISMSNGSLVFREADILKWNRNRNILNPLIKLSPYRDLYCHAVVNGSLYVMGGRINGIDCTSCMVYNIAENQWTAFPGDMLRKTSGRPSVVFGGKIYVTSGSINEVLSELDVIDPEANTWTKVSNIPVPSYGHAIDACEEYIWIFGGHDVSRCLSGVYRFCPNSKTWEEKSRMPTARTNLSVSYFGRRFFVTGGLGDKDEPLDVVEIYDPTDDKWEAGPSLLSPRSGHCTTVLQLKHDMK